MEENQKAIKEVLYELMQCTTEEIYEIDCLWQRELKKNDHADETVKMLAHTLCMGTIECKGGVAV